MGIREYRKKKNITQRELAKMVGVDHTAISKYESGQVIPRADILRSIAEVLEVPVDCLVEEGTGDILKNLPVEKIASVPGIFDEFSDLAIPDYEGMKKLLIAWTDGRCELCGHRAPYNDKDGVPYLEIHHVIWLDAGGLPVPTNTVVLCPNCHKKMHVLGLNEDIKKLKRVAKNHFKKSTI